MKKLRAADSHMATRMLGDLLASKGELEAAARTIAKIVRFETAPMGQFPGRVPISERQQLLLDLDGAMPSAPKPDHDSPDEFAGLLN